MSKLTKEDIEELEKIDTNLLVSKPLSKLEQELIDKYEEDNNVKYIGTVDMYYVFVGENDRRYVTQIYVTIY